MKLWRVAPALTVILGSGALAQAEPSLAVWSGALIWPLLVGASLFVARAWSATPPPLAILAAVFSTLPAVHHAWVFNIEGNMLLAWSGLFALVPLLLAVVVARRTPLVSQIGSRRAVLALVVAVSACSYGMGAAYFANTFFDQGPVQRYTATVKARFVRSHFGFLFKQYEVNVTPWGDHQSVDSISVPRDVFEALRDGEQVHIEQSPGLLGIPWVQARAH